MAVPVIQTSLAGGEIAPSLYGAVDVAKLHSAAATMRNMFVNRYGGASSRAGTAMVGRCKQSGASNPPRDISFQFNSSQGYVLEFGTFYMRVKSLGGYVTETALTITGATNANPCQVTAANSYSAGDWVFITGVAGMTQLNGNTYIVGSATGAHFTLEDLNGNALDSTAYGTYTSGGTVARLLTVTTPYAAKDLPYLKIAQSADTLSLTCSNPSDGTEYAPQEVTRVSATNWTIAATSFAAPISAPSGLTGTANVAASPPTTLPASYAYAVTAIDSTTGQESIASSILNIVNSVDMSVTAGSISIDWSPVAGAGFYNVYRTAPGYNTAGSGGTADPVPVGSPFGFLGSTLSTQFVDSNSTPDFTTPPPQHKNPFAQGPITRIAMTAAGSTYTTASITITTSTGSGFSAEPLIIGGQIIDWLVLNGGQGYKNSDTMSITGDGTGATGNLVVGPQSGTYPGVVSYFQQRRFYADSFNLPVTFNASKPGAYTDFDASVPVTADDAITGTPAAEQVDGIQWMVSMPTGLVTFTTSAVWLLSAPGSWPSSPQPITPSNALAAFQSSIGSSPILPPIKVDWEILYAQNAGYTIRELSYQVWFNIFTGIDISWPSSHLFLNHTITQWAWCEQPYRIVWAVRDDGILLSLTYLKEQQIAGWARHDTQGLVRGVCSILEPATAFTGGFVLNGARNLQNTNALYLIVQRFDQNGNSVYFSERMDDRIWESAEDPWCVDCALCYCPATGAGTLSASAASGSGVTFTATSSNFTAGSVGQVIRMGGGIAVITAYTSAEIVTGEWVLPCQETVPNDPNNAVSPQTEWSIGTPTTSLTGFVNLAGKSLVGLADGVPIGPLVPDSLGNVTLPFAASNIFLGLGYTAQLQSVYLDAGEPTIQGRRKNIYAVTVRMTASSKIQVGANQVDAAALTPRPFFSAWTLPAAVISPDAPATYTSPGGQAVQLPWTGDTRVVIPAEWKKPGQVAVQQTAPLPFNVLALIPEIQPGDMPESQVQQQRSGTPAGNASPPPSGQPSPEEMRAFAARAYG